MNTNQVSKTEILKEKNITRVFYTKGQVHPIN